MIVSTILERLESLASDSEQEPELSFESDEEQISDVKVENVVATATLDHKMDLPCIYKAIKITEYNPEKFPGVILRLKRPKTSTLIFRTGKMVCTGARSEREAQSAIRKVVRLLKSNGIIILNNPKIDIVNIVASGNMGEGIDLERASRKMENVMYEPEQFPGLIYRMKEPKTVILLFASGKIVCTGAKREKQVYNAVEKLSKILEEKDLFYTRWSS